MKFWTPSTPGSGRVTRPFFACFCKRTLSVVKNPAVEKCVSDQTCCDISVVLCDHSNTERGYLQSDYAELLRKELPGVSIASSQSDQDPLQIV